MAQPHRTVTFEVDIDSRANKPDVITITATTGDGKRHLMGMLEADGWAKTQFLEALKRGAKALCTEHDEVKIIGTDWASHDHRRHAAAD